MLSKYCEIYLPHLFNSAPHELIPLFLFKLFYPPYLSKIFRSSIVSLKNGNLKLYNTSDDLKTVAEIIYVEIIRW